MCFYETYFWFVKRILKKQVASGFGIDGNQILPD